MSTYKLHYFNARARAEGIRWLLSLGGVEFEDIRIAMEDWPKIKPQMTMGRVPVLEVNGEQLGESQAIGRFLANKFSLLGKSDWEKAVADQYVDIVYDVLAEMRAISRSQDEKSKAENKKKLLEEVGPKVLGFFQKKLESSKSGFLVGDSLTWADVFVASYFDSFIDRLSPQFGEMLDKYPKVRAHLGKIRAVPQIAAFITKRPNTAM